jgi:hypothetical protein
MKNRSLLILGIVLFFLISLVFLYFRRQHLLNEYQHFNPERIDWQNWKIGDELDL